MKTDLLRPFTMKLPQSSILTALLAAGAIASPDILPASAQQLASKYPIGIGGSNAKVAGRLFNVDGKVKYFAGKDTSTLNELY